MHFLAVSLRKDLARIRRDPFALLPSFAIPLVLAVLITLVFGRDPATPHGRLLVADEDHTFASASLLGAFRNRELAGMFTVENTSRAAGRQRMDRGDASALIIVPRGFQQAFSRNQQFPLELYTNPSERILPQIVESTMSLAAEAASYMRLGVALPRNPAGAGGLITVETAVIHPRRRSISFATVFLPSMLFMGMLFAANSFAADIWRERTSGTLRRLAYSPTPLSWYLIGRVVFVSAVYLAVSFAGLWTAQHLAGMEISNLPAAVLWMTFTGVVFYLLFLCIAMSGSTPRAAAVLANLVVFPLAMLGGCFFPFEWMPQWMASIGKLTPNGWAITQFKAILVGASSAGQSATATAALALSGLLMFVFALRRLRTGFAV